jgi:uncharacterized protein (TIGR00251 family)
MWYRWENDDLLLTLRVQPKASKDEFAGPMEDAYKVRITAPPVDGKANDHLIRFLAKAFGVPRSRVALVAGTASRRKAVRIQSPQSLPIAEISTR